MLYLFCWFNLVIWCLYTLSVAVVYRQFPIVVIKFLKEKLHDQIADQFLDFINSQSN